MLDKGENFVDCKVLILDAFSCENPWRPSDDVNFVTSSYWFKPKKSRRACHVLDCSLQVKTCDSFKTSSFWLSCTLLTISWISNVGEKRKDKVMLLHFRLDLVIFFFLCLHFCPSFWVKTFDYNFRTSCWDAKLLLVSLCTHATFFKKWSTSH